MAYSAIISCMATNIDVSVNKYIEIALPVIKYTACRLFFCEENNFLISADILKIPWISFLLLFFVRDLKRSNG